MFTTTELHFDPAYKNLLAENGLQTFDALMHNETGTVVSDSNETQIRRIELDDRDKTVVFLKRTLCEPMNRSLAMFFRLVWPHTRSYKELQLIHYLLKFNFPVMTPIAWGEKRILGIPAKGFVAVTEIVGTELEERFVNSKYRERSRLITQMGSLLGRLNANGFYHVVRLKDIIIAEEQAKFWDKGDLVLIDREVAKPWPRSFSPNRCCYCLARCYAKFIRARYQLPPRQQLRFMKAYRNEIQTDWPVTAEELVKRTTQELAKILKGPRYKNVKFRKFEF